MKKDTQHFPFFFSYHFIIHTTAPSLSKLTLPHSKFPIPIRIALDSCNPSHLIEISISKPREKDRERERIPFLHFGSISVDMKQQFFLSWPSFVLLPCITPLSFQERPESRKMTRTEATVGVRKSISLDIKVYRYVGFGRRRSSSSSLFL